MAQTDSYRALGLFAGIGGLELGFERAGHEARVLCEIDPAAQSVLRERFPDVPITPDVADVHLQDGDQLVLAGFPCTDLSQAGKTAGIGGRYSGLIGQVFRMLDEGRDPEWVLLENVPFMLVLGKGSGIRYLTSEFAKRGFRWAYRVVDAQAFGLPQRRRRVFFLASKTHDPRDVLLVDNAEPRVFERGSKAVGFYWTEGTRGLGWAIDAVPTLKGGSTVGIPSPPAIWLADGRIVTPEIRDAERLQGFDEDWTRPAQDAGFRAGQRWKMVGNAVCVPVAEWLGARLARPGTYSAVDKPLLGDRWPESAWGKGDEVFVSRVGSWPFRREYASLQQFLAHEPKLLSERATLGFMRRLSTGNLRYEPAFLDALVTHYLAIGGRIETLWEHGITCEKRTA